MNTNLSYDLHQVNKRIEHIIKTYDDTGALAIIQAKIMFKRMLQNGSYNALEYMKNSNIVKGWIVDEIFEDIGSGLNYNRKKWSKLLEDCMLGTVSKIIVSHKDRFIRFGFEWFEKFVKSNGVDLVIVNNEKLSPQEEIVQDIISILHVFSCRVYGLRKYKKKIEEDGELLCELTKQK